MNIGNSNLKGDMMRAFYVNFSTGILCTVCLILHAENEILRLDRSKNFSSAWIAMQKVHADKLSIEELFLMANYCKEGRKDVAVNRDQSRNFFSMIKKRLSLDSCNDPFSLYLRGIAIINTDFDTKQAYKYIKEAADAGHPDAEVEIAIMLLKGIGVESSPSLAMYYLKKAVAQGNLTAKAYLASYYLGQKKDIRRGIFLAEESSNGGNRAGQYTLGMAFEKGVGVSKDEMKALRLYQLSADQGLPDARDRLYFLKKRLNIPNDQYIDDGHQSNDGEK